MGAGLGGVEEAALLLQFGGFAKQGVGGVEALEIVGCCAAVVFAGEFEVVGGGVEQAEEVGSAEGLAAFAADGMVAGDELAALLLQIGEGLVFGGLSLGVIEFHVFRAAYCGLCLRASCSAAVRAILLRTYNNSACAASAAG